MMHCYRDGAARNSRLTSLDFALWGWMKSVVYKRKVDTRDELLARVLDPAARINICEYQLDDQHAIFARELQSALRLAVRFSNI